MQTFKVTLIVFAISIAMLAPNRILSQVTIGNSEAPAAGALLQLKNISGVVDDGVNADKGLLLPRVSLINPLNLNPLSSDQDVDTKDEYTGIVVYNMTENELICQGLHVWDSREWISLSDKKIEYIVDTRISIVDGREETHIYPAQNFGDAGI